MISLQSVLAAGIAQQIPTYLLIAVAAIVAIGFLAGFAKGFRRVKKANIFWGVAGVAFVFGYKWIGNKNKLSKPLAGTALENLSSLFWVLIIAVACVVASLVLLGIISALFRPKAIRKKKVTAHNDDFAFEVEETEEVTEKEYFSKKKKVKKKVKYKPSFFARLFGGVFGAVNVAVITVVVIGVATLILHSPLLCKGAIRSMFDVKLMRLLVKYSSTYALDFLTIGILFGMAYRGYKVGFLGSANKVLSTVGKIAVIGLCFAIPFIGKVADMSVFASIIERCVDLFSKIKGDKIEVILGKVLAGVIFAVAAGLVMLLLTLLLRSLTSCIKGTKVVKVVDGTIGMLIYVLLGVVICAAVWAVLYLLNYCGLLYTSQLFDSKASLAQEFFAVAERYLQKIADKFLLKLKA